MSEQINFTDLFASGATCELLTVDYRQLVPYEADDGRHNPRTEDNIGVHNLAESIKDVPELFLNRIPITSNRTGKLMVIAGHKRWLALTGPLGVTHGPAYVWTGLTAEQEEKIMLLDNPLQGIGGEWDYQALKGFEATLKSMAVDTDAMFANATMPDFDPNFAGEGGEKEHPGSGEGGEEKTARFTIFVPMDDVIVFEIELDALLNKYADVSKSKKVVNKRG